MNGHVNGHANGHINGHANWHGNGEANGHANGEGNGHVVANASWHANGHPHGRAGAEGNAGGNGSGSEESCSNGSGFGDTGNGRHFGWRFHIAAGGFGEGSSTHVIVKAFRKGNGESVASGKKMTIMHETGSLSTPFVPITISVNGSHGHGFARGFAPRGNSSRESGATPTDVVVAATPPMGGAPAQQGVAGTQFAGGGSNGGGSAPQSATAPSRRAPSAGSPSGGQQAVLGASGSGNGGSAGPAATAPASAFASRSSKGNLPYTGSNLVFMLLIAAGCLGSGLALRRAAGSTS
jgi:hypothetical protein